MANLHPKTTQWSDSKYNVKKQCDFRFYHQYIVKTKVEQDTYHLDSGIAVHKKGEEFLKGNIQGVPKEYFFFKDEMKELKRDSAVPESDIGVTYNWAKSHGTDWNNIWLRGKVDAIVDAYVDEIWTDDFKTGRVYEDKAKQQSEIYGICLPAHYPDYSIFNFRFLYLDKNKKLEFSYTIDDIKKLRAKWKRKFNDAHKDIQNMLDNDDFPKSKSGLCGYCPYRKSNNGPCCYE